MTEICNLFKGFYLGLIECAVYSVGGVAHAVVVNIATLAQHQSRYYTDRHGPDINLYQQVVVSQERGSVSNRFGFDFGEGRPGDRQKPAATVM